MKTISEQTRLDDQAGGGMLTVVAVLGLLLMLVQGSVYYRAKAGAKYLGAEKNKVLAMQMAEAGVEENIADLGKRKTKVRMGQVDTITYENKVLEGGRYTSKLTTLAVGDSADTVELKSTGKMGKGSHSILTRLKLRKHLSAVPQYDSTVTTTVTPTVMNPASVAALTTQPAYTACMTGIPTNCFICHLGGGDPNTKIALNQPRALLAPVHGGHVGDYITTSAAACYAYDTVMTASSVITYDTTNIVDTVVKVQILSWK